MSNMKSCAVIGNVCGGMRAKTKFETGKLINKLFLSPSRTQEVNTDTGKQLRKRRQRETLAGII
jgi:hypothetical protein